MLTPKCKEEHLIRRRAASTRGAWGHSHESVFLANITSMSAIVDHPHRHPVSVQEFLRMGEAAVFAPEARLELIEGEILEMAPIGSAHASVVAALARVLSRAVGDRAIVWVQNPIVLGAISMPQPDLALLKPSADGYYHAHPTRADTLLVIEVSDSTLSFDLRGKVPLYARAGVPEVWVVDIVERAVHAHRDPTSGGYLKSLTATAGEDVASLLLPEARIAVSDLFPR